MTKYLMSMLVTAMLSMLSYSSAFAVWGDSFDYLSHVNEDIPDPTSVGMLDCTEPGYRFSAVAVDQYHVGIIHTSSRNMWEKVQVQLPRPVYQYRLALYGPRLLIYGGYLSDNQLNPYVFLLKIADTQDAMNFEEMGIIPEMANDCTLEADQQGGLLFSVYDGARIARYQAAVNAGYRITSWSKLN